MVTAPSRSNSCISRAPAGVAGPRVRRPSEMVVARSDRFGASEDSTTGAPTVNSRSAKCTASPSRIGPSSIPSPFTKVPLVLAGRARATRRRPRRSRRGPSRWTRFEHQLEAGPAADAEGQGMEGNAPVVPRLTRCQEIRARLEDGRFSRKGATLPFETSGRAQGRIVQGLDRRSWPPPQATLEVLRVDSQGLANMVAQSIQASTSRFSDTAPVPIELK